MRRVFYCVLLVPLWIGAGRGEAQTLEVQKQVENKLEQMRLEQMIGEALKGNPDIRVAESKVRDAEAELHRTRMKVLSDITLLHAEIQAAQAEVDEGAAQYERFKKLVGSRAFTAQEMAQVKPFLKSKTNLAMVQARLPYLLGKASASDLHFSIRLHAANALGNVLVDPAQSPKDLGPQQGEVVKYLNKLTRDQAVSDEEFLRRVMLDLLGRLPTAEETKEFMKQTERDRREKWVDKVQKTKRLDELRSKRLDELRTRHELYLYDLSSLALKSASPLTDKLRKALDKPVRLDAQKLSSRDILELVRDKMLAGVNLTVRPKALKKDGVDIGIRESIPLGAFLQYLEDELDVVFVLRDYGIVVVGADERLPPGAISVIDFWKRGKAAEKPSQAKEKK